MTGKLTPRLGLMAPVNADVFTPDDFTDTFTKLDNAPGVTMIDSLGALPTGLTNAQHGSLYLERDNGALWMWKQPTTGSTGSWMRANNIGNIATVGMPAAMAWTSEFRFLSLNFTVPGGRWVGIKLFIPLIWVTSPHGICITQIHFNGNFLTRAHLVASVSTVGWGYLEGWINLPAGTAVTAEAWMYPYGGGSVTVAESYMTVFEV